MKLFKYIILILLVCNIPGIVQANFGLSMGSMSSYASYILLLIFYFLSKKSSIATPFVVFAIAYFVFSGLTFVPIERDYFLDFVKFLIIIICGGELVRRCTSLEICILLLIGASSIFINATFFPNDYGRYSGFYINPNEAGFACIMGCAMAFSIKDTKWKAVTLFLFTFFGILTFSRTFFVLWILLILISIFHNVKNLIILGIGVVTLVLMLSLTQEFKLNTERLSIIEGIFNDGSISNSAAEDSRTKTWALYYDKIFESPFLGNGYKAFTGGENTEQGVHNNYLRIWGESGIIPFLIFSGIYFFILYMSTKLFKSKVYMLLLAVSLLAIHLVTHNFDTLHHVTLVSLWVYFGVNEYKKNEITTTEI